MKEATAKRLMRAAKRLGYTGRDCDRDERITMSKSYSGRGMYGRQTYSLNLPDMTYLAMLAAAAVVKRADREDFALEMKSMASDGMGLGVVVY